MPSEIALAPNPIFRTVQSEGHLSGTTFVFVRLSGCDVGCGKGCDTAFSVGSRLELSEITSQVYRLMGDFEPWVWITGGEPAMRGDVLEELVTEFHRYHWRVAVATSGTRPGTIPVDWLSVSPHRSDIAPRQLYGHEVKLVPGLGPNGGLDARRWIERFDTSLTRFWFRYLQPMAGNPESLAECLRIWGDYPRWGIQPQTHTILGLP